MTETTNKPMDLVQEISEALAPSIGKIEKLASCVLHAREIAEKVLKEEYVSGYKRGLSDGHGELS